MRLIVALACFLVLLTPAFSKTFLVTNQVCYIAGGQVFISNEKYDHFSEIMGPPNSVAAQFCTKDFITHRSCKQVMLYNFQVACRGGSATLPQWFMAAFGNDKSTRDSSMALSPTGNQLSYIDPGRDVYDREARRTAFPVGYAPLPAIEGRLKSLDWDTTNGRLTLAKSLRPDQERRISDLFTMRAGLVEPFPESHIATAVKISEEAPPRAQPREPPPASKPDNTPQTPWSKAEIPETVSVRSIVIGAIIWLFGFIVSRIVPTDSRILKISVGGLASIVSSVLLYALGVKEGLTLLTVTLGGIIFVSVSVFF